MDRRKKTQNSSYSQTIAQIKGELAIEKVMQALDSLKILKVVREFGFTDTFSREDIKGIDVIIYLHRIYGGKILLQVKSSFSLEQKRKYNKRGIVYLAVPPKMDPYEVEERLSEILARIYIRKIEEGKYKNIIAPKRSFFFLKIMLK